MKSIVMMSILAAVLSCPDEKFCRRCLVNPDGKNLCQKCEEQFFSIETHLCQKSSKPVDNCFLYSDEVTCTECKEEFYLDNNTCKKIGIEKCLVAKVAENKVTGCKICKDGFIAGADGKCTSDKKCSTQSCELCTDSDLCYKCDSKHSLFIKDDKTTCVEGSENCKEVLEGEEKKCLECHKGFYVSKDFKCVDNNYIPPGPDPKPDPVPDKGSNVWVWVLLILLALGVIGALAYFFVIKKNTDNEYHAVIVN